MMLVPNHPNKTQTISHFHTLNTLQEAYPHIITYNHILVAAPETTKSLTSDDNLTQTQHHLVTTQRSSTIHPTEKVMLKQA